MSGAGGGTALARLAWRQAPCGGPARAPDCLLLTPTPSTHPAHRPPTATLLSVTDDSAALSVSGPGFAPTGGWASYVLRACPVSSGACLASVQCAASPCTVSGLAALKTYRVSVQAVAGNTSSLEAQVQVTTLHG